MKFRGQRFATEIMKFLNKTCAERAIRYFRNDVVIQNIASLTNIVKANILPVEFYFNITINSFLSFSKKPVETLDDGVSTNVDRLRVITSLKDEHSSM